MYPTHHTGKEKQILQESKRRHVRRDRQACSNYPVEEGASPMPTPRKNQKHHPSGTYFVPDSQQDRQQKEELQRLIHQDRLVTASMGGVLSEQTEPGAFRRVLDVACGSGGWARGAAQTYPEMELVGI